MARVASLTGVLIAVAAPLLAAQRADTAVVLAWRLPPGTSYSLELIDSLSSGPAGKEIEVHDRTRLDIRGETSGPDGIRMRVIRRNWVRVSLDHGHTWSSEQEAGTQDSVVLLMTPSGRLEPVEQGSRLSAGAVIEDLAGDLPFTLPIVAVRPGESWPLAQTGIRHNRMFGQMQFDLQGEATLDSITDDRAYLSVRARSHGQTDRMEHQDSITAHVVWEISTGRPLTVEQSSRTDWLRGGAPGNPPMYARSAVRLLPSTPTPAAAPTP